MTEMYTIKWNAGQGWYSADVAAGSLSQAIGYAYGRAAEDALDGIEYTAKLREEEEE